MKIINTLIFCASVASVYPSMATEIVTPIGAGCDTEDGTCYVILRENLVSSNCQYKNQLRLDPNKKGSKSQYSTGLAAFMGGKKLVVEVNGCHQNHPAPSFFYVID
ncbi:hypothetical protein L4D08_00335 [Photobacterium chitinilyticum]|uniref:hypothetical protein n=1 Tax=Photobacterium chitinilyticum TaxID=2485123 RepID=UPI003D0D9472